MCLKSSQYPNLFPFLGENLETTLGKSSKKTANYPHFVDGTSKVKKCEKKTFFARRFSTIFKKKCSYLRPLLFNFFPQGFRISKNIGHPTSKSGDKKTIKKDRKPKKTEKSEEKNFFLHGDFRQFSNKNVHI